MPADASSEMASNDESHLPAQVLLQPNKRLFDPNTDNTASGPTNRRSGARPDQSLTSRRGHDLRTHLLRSHKKPFGDQIRESFSSHRRPIVRDNSHVIKNHLVSHLDDEGLMDLEPRILLQPETRPIIHDQLVIEVKDIYAGLVMVEAKSIDIDDQNSNPSYESDLTRERWQALIALHKTLLHEHHDFLLASQHPSASPALSLYLRALTCTPPLKNVEGNKDNSPEPEENVGRPLPEDYIMRGQMWCDDYYLNTWFSGAKVDDEDRNFELRSFAALRVGCCISRDYKIISWNSSRRNIDMPLSCSTYVDRKAVLGTDELEKEYAKDVGVINLKCMLQKFRANGPFYPLFYLLTLIWCSSPVVLANNYDQTISETEIVNTKEQWALNWLLLPAAMILLFGAGYSTHYLGYKLVWGTLAVASNFVFYEIQSDQRTTTAALWSTILISARACYCYGKIQMQENGLQFSSYTPPILITAAVIDWATIKSLKNATQEISPAGLFPLCVLISISAWTATIPLVKRYAAGLRHYFDQLLHHHLRYIDREEQHEGSNGDRMV